MPVDFAPLFSKLKPILARHAPRLSVHADTPPPELMAELEHLTAAAIEQWAGRKWL